MGLDYALVHLKFTIPLATLLSIIARPLLTRLDAARILFILTIAVTATIPWDSYLIRTGVWTYPEDGVLGPAPWGIPIEELFFFVVQTYITAVGYILCNKPLLLSQYLTTPETRPEHVKWGKVGGQALLAGLAAHGAWLVSNGAEGTYLGLILAWACPFALFTWSITGEMILAMPWTSSALPILAPTLYLWLVDELSLRQGVWTIESNTKLGRQLFGSLEIEEAVFFLVTNTLIVFGIAAFDKAVAVCDAFPDTFAHGADSVPVKDLLRARVMPTSAYDMQRIAQIADASTRLKKKSRSFYIASSVFPGRLRIDMTLLYSYCRLADDLVDNATSLEEATTYITKLRRHLDIKFQASGDNDASKFIRSNFPTRAHSALELLPTNILLADPLYALLDGFETDLEFSAPSSWPIHDEDDLELYASRVASTVGESCLHLVFFHTKHNANTAVLLAAAKEMGIALQYVNIVRDVSVDAAMGRVYLPTAWLKEEKLTPEMVIANPTGEAVERLRKRLLGKAFARYKASRPSMDLLPGAARGPMTVAVESYMEIGRVLAEGGLRVEGKATVPAWRRAGVVWKTLMRV